MTTADWIRHAAIWAGFMGQTVFIISYVSTRWWVHWVTRSLMFKSAAMWLLLALTVYRYTLRYLSSQPPWVTPSGPDTLGDDTEAALYVLVAVAIIVQAGALLRERSRSRILRGLPPAHHS